MVLMSLKTDVVFSVTGGKYSNYLKKTNLNLMSTTQCDSYYDKNHPVTDNMICARSPAWNTDACGVSMNA